jgi:alkylated DNA repair dioxygenase AlkB
MSSAPPTAPTTPLQTSLFGAGDPAIDPTFTGIERTELAHGAWIERLPGWLAGEQTVFDELVGSTAWHANRRPMYDRVVDVPRLTASLPGDGPGHPVLADIVTAVSARVGEPCERIGLAWYRDGRDSVAPHGDQVARTMQATAMAIVSCGARRRFHLAPVTGGRGLSFELGRGDLLVMGGTIQRTWRHGVPKTNRPVGPRLSMMFRPPWME